MTKLRIDPDLVSLAKTLYAIEDLPTRQLAIGSLLTKVFIDNELAPPVLVGGMAVAVYSQGLYKTTDLDFLSYSSEVDLILKSFGYAKTGKDYFSKTLSSYIEFPTPKTEWDNDKVRLFKVESTNLSLYVIGLEDLILDRVGSYAATNSLQCKEWALRLMAAFYKYLDWSYLHRTSKSLGTLNHVNKLQREIKRYRSKYASLVEEETTAGISSSVSMKLF